MTTTPVQPTATARPVHHVEVPDRLRAVKRRTPRSVKVVARRGLRRYGEATAHERVLPDFLVIGTKRGGTTSLINWLFSHPQVMPMFPAAQQIKSPHFFDINYWRGEGWYRSHFPTRRAMDRVERRTGHRPVVGEASPYYLFHPAVAQRVSETVPDVRLVVLLRDPVKRAYSNYWERVGSGAESLPTFEAALAAEEERTCSVTPELLARPDFYSTDHDWHTYLARGRYLEQLEPWLARFGRERILIVRSEDLYAAPQDMSATVQRFLGLPVAAIDRLDHHNKLPVPPMREETRRLLAEYYRPHNEALFQRLGVDFAWTTPEA